MVASLKLEPDHPLQYVAGLYRLAGAVLPIVFVDPSGRAVEMVHNSDRERRRTHGRTEAVAAVGDDLDAGAPRVGEAGAVDVALGAAEVIAAPRMVVLRIGAVSRGNSLRKSAVDHRHALGPADMVVGVIGPVGVAVPFQAAHVRRQFKAEPDLAG